MESNELRRPASHRLAFAFALLVPALVGASVVTAAPAAPEPADHWTAAWYSPPLPPTAVWSCNQEVNAWIRKGQGFDGVVDFDAALRDPSRPLELLGPDQCGDDLHPNDAGYHAMAEAAFQRLFAPGSSAHAPLARAASVVPADAGAGGAGR